VEQGLTIVTAPARNAPGMLANSSRANRKTAAPAKNTASKNAVL